MRKVAAARMVGLISSRIPDHIWRGMVRWFRPPMKRTMTTSSKEAAKAKSAPESTPGVIRGNCTRRKVVSGPAPRLWEARTRLRSNPDRVAVTVITTNGVPRAAWARTRPKCDWVRRRSE